MKKLFVLLLVVAMTLTFASCDLDELGISDLIEDVKGSLSVTGENGYVGQLGGDWPENEFSKLIPKPEFEIYSSVVTEVSFMVSFKDVSLEDTKAFATKLVEAGFTVDANTVEEEKEGVVLYSYTAKNADGYMLTYNYSMNMLALSINKVPTYTNEVTPAPDVDLPAPDVVLPAPSPEV